MGVEFERGDLVMFRHLREGVDTQSGGIVVSLDDGLLTVALPQGVEVWNMRGPHFASAWRVDHTPGPMTEVEVLEYAAVRLRDLRRRPLVIVEPEDDRLFSPEPHSHGAGEMHTHEGGLRHAS